MYIDLEELQIILIPLGFEQQIYLQAIKLFEAISDHCDSVNTK